MTWQEFPFFVGGSIGCWSLGIGLGVAARKSLWLKQASKALLFTGTLLIIFFLSMLWLALERPPLRTLGETRLWYAALLPLVGYLMEYRWGIRWLTTYCVGLASLFLLINLAHPEIYDKTLMPALQSIWFIPHVVVYMVAYALLAASSLVAFHGLYLQFKHRNMDRSLELADQLVLLGYSFLTMGLLFGALWAKEAWGHYWSWDPKETWAFLTWIAYLVYLHLRHHHPNATRMRLSFLAMSFVVLLICWFGVNYLPSASYSVHTYSQ